MSLAQPATSGGRITSSAVIFGGTARLYSLIVEADATNAATVTLYDNATAASGTILAKWIVKATDTSGSPSLPNNGILANNGIYASISGTGAACIVHYSRD